jgi:hypothetical protein
MSFPSFPLSRAAAATASPRRRRRRSGEQEEAGAGGGGVIGAKFGRPSTHSTLRKVVEKRCSGN